MTLAPLHAEVCALLLVDFQARLMPAMAGGEASLAQAQRLREAADLFDVPVLLTEQVPDSLGRSDATLRAGHPVLEKASFDATSAPGFAAALPQRATILVAGWEAHVCVMQTALGLLGMGRDVAIIADAVASRVPASREVALARLARAGADIVTVEMAVFGWLGSATHPHFRDALALVK